MPSAPAHAHLVALQHGGVGLWRVVALTGLSFRTVQAIRRGVRPLIHPTTAAAILGVTHPSLADGQTVSGQASYQTRERVRRLVEEQYPLPWLQARLGRHALRLAARDPAHEGQRVRVKTWRVVKALYDATLGDEQMTLRAR